MVMFMPWPTKLREPVNGVDMVMGMTLPAWFMWPNLSTGCWQDCYADPDKIRLLNGFLWLMKCADSASCTCYIEIVPESKLLESNTMVQVCYYRLHVPLTSSSVRTMILNMAMALSPESALEQSGPKAKRRRSNNDSGDDSRFTEHAANFRMTNTEIGAGKIDSWAALLQWHATATGNTAAGRHRTILFDLPPENAFEDGGLETDSADEDGAVLQAMNNDDGDVGNPFSEWLDKLPANHVVKMLDLRSHFITGMRRHDGRLHSSQLDYLAYVDNNTFQFPTYCDAHELATRVEPNAPWLDGNVDNLILAPFAHSAATLSMYPEELFRKMRSMSSISGLVLPESYRNKTLAELRALPGYATPGQDDVSHYSPIVMLPPAERRPIGAGESDSVRILADMYPASGRLTDSVSGQLVQLREAKRLGHIDGGDVQAWYTETIDRLDQLYADAAKEGFVGAYFRIASESAGIKRHLHSPGHDHVLKEAVRFLATRIDGMDAGNSMHALMARLLRGNMHMTPAQAAPLQFIWNGTLTAIMPEINEAQPTVALLGQSDTGKSRLMEALQLMMPQSACVRKDTGSKLCMTSHSELGVQTTDELKTGVDSQNAGDATAWLTAWSTGWHVHERLVLGKRPGEPTANVVTRSDRRRYMVTATNGTPGKSHASRMHIYYMNGQQLETEISRQELSTLSDNTTAFLSAKLVFKSVWAEHECFWRTHQHVRFYICTSWYSVWQSLANVVMGKIHRPSTRHVRSIARMAKGYMLTRLIAQYNNTDKTVSFIEYAIANAVVTMCDYTQCYVQQQSKADQSGEDGVILQALLDNIAVEEPIGGAFKLEVYDREYYATTLSTVQEVCARTTVLTNAHGIGKDVIDRLEQVDASNKGRACAKLVKMKGHNNGRYAVHKSMVSVETGSVQTSSMDTILKYLREDVVGKPQLANGANIWYVGLDESQVVMKPTVLKRLLTPHLSGVDSPVLDDANMSEIDCMRGLLLLEASGAIQFRDLGANHPYVLAGEGCIVTNTQGPNSALVDRGGPLDELRLFGDAYLTEVVDGEIDDVWLDQQCRAHDCRQQPRRREYKSSLRLPDAFVVRTDVVRDVLDANLVAKLGATPILTAPDTQENAVFRLWDAISAISGEQKPDSIVHAGISVTSSDPYETYTIRPWPTEHIDLLNPRRQTEASGAGTDYDLDNVLLPAGVTKVRFLCGVNKTAQLEQQVAAINMVEYAALKQLPA